MPNFVGGATQPLVRVPVMSGDELFRFLTCGGDNYVDVSYAAAWELGRLLALRDKNFSTALFRWKRECYQFRKSAANNSLNSHLTLKISAGQYPAMPAFVRLWFDELILLKGVPFNYLVPLEALLPFESLRFFSIDSQWLRYLLDGAFSIGRLSPADSAADAELYGMGILILDGAIPQSGFMLRSKAVDGWPDLVLETDRQLLRREELSKDLLCCLYNEQITFLSINQKPESVHFGFVDKDDDSSQLCVEYTAKPGSNQLVDVNCNILNKVDLEKIRVDIRVTDVAGFTSALIQKIEKITFKIS